MVYYSSINKSDLGLDVREEHYRLFQFPVNTPHVLLKTCNRVEIYTGSGEISRETVRHLFRVVSGLESGITGESAIQGQVKLAYEEAKSTHDLSASLHRLFQQALRVGKRVRSSSGIGKGAVSHGQATVEMIASSGIELNNARIALIGVNKLTEDTIRFLQQKGAETIFVANRSYHKALPYAEKYQCKIFHFDNLLDVLSKTDVLISATSAPYTVVRKDKFPKNKSMKIFDLAFPRDVDYDIAGYPGVSLYNLDDIEDCIRKNIRKRSGEVLVAESIIEQEVDKFYTEKNVRKIKSN